MWKDVYEEFSELTKSEHWLELGKNYAFDKRVEQMLFPPAKNQII